MTQSISVVLPNGTTRNVTLDGDQLDFTLLNPQGQVLLEYHGSKVQLQALTSEWNKVDQALMWTTQ